MISVTAQRIRYFWCLILYSPKSLHEFLSLLATRSTLTLQQPEVLQAQEGIRAAES
jgi:hypothetical protein